MILPRECLTAGSQERWAWVSTQTRRAQYMLKMKQIQQLFAKFTYSMLHPKWVLLDRSNSPYLVTVGVTNQILCVPAYRAIYSQKSCSQLLHAHEILQPLLRLQESKAMRVRSQNEYQPRPTLLYIPHNSTAYVQ